VLLPSPEVPAGIEWFLRGDAATRNRTPCACSGCSRKFVACTLRELGGLPQTLPETEKSVPFLRVFSSGPFS
jgi:hypothetical protein